MARNKILTAVFAAGIAAAATATLATRPDAVSDLAFSAATTAPSVLHTPRESAACRTAKRQIAMYSRALSQLNTAAAQQHPAVAVYRQARHTEKLWHDAHCGPRFDAVVRKTEPRVQTLEARS